MLSSYWWLKQILTFSLSLLPKCWLHTQHNLANLMLQFTKWEGCSNESILYLLDNFTTWSECHLEAAVMMSYIKIFYRIEAAKRNTSSIYQNIHKQNTNYRFKYLQTVINMNSSFYGILWLVINKGSARTCLPYAVRLRSPAVWLLA